MSFLDDFEMTLRKADIQDSAKNYLFKVFLTSQLFPVFLSVILIFVFLSQGQSPLPVLALYFMFSLVFFVLFMTIPVMKIKSKKTDIDFDLVYTVRHLLLRLESGFSLLNSLEEVSNLETKSSKLFSKLLFDIEMGSTLKHAVERSMKYSVSAEYSKVLGNIKTALETGSDLNKSLKNTLDGLVVKKKENIRGYGKRLNPITMFYMIFGTIAPSVGASGIIMASSFLSFIGQDLARVILIVFAVMIFIIQVSFYMVFNALRPKVF